RNTFLKSLVSMRIDTNKGLTENNFYQPKIKLQKSPYHFICNFASPLSNHKKNFTIQKMTKYAISI
ncbi:hypothetical protein P4313_30100, partial [Bacillus tropicus]|uniref:hypothetical protein n=1 Tax=Bacillus tropicus TaxID=2026188 RepID=UPI002E1F87B4|nr:hypothetical protein [Bacillus tropicus]